MYKMQWSTNYSNIKSCNFFVQPKENEFISIKILITNKLVANILEQNQTRLLCRFCCYWKKKPTSTEHFVNFDIYFLFVLIFRNVFVRGRLNNNNNLLCKNGRNWYIIWYCYTNANYGWLVSLQCRHISRDNAI